MLADEQPRTQRAASLPADERRAALIAATLPLVLEHGPAVTTRQIAQAAGIAEGTIFRVFPDKDSLLHAVVESAFDPEPMIAALRQIDAALPFEQRLVAVVEIVQERSNNIWRLLAAIGPGAKPAPRKPPDIAEIVAMFEPHRHQLSCPPAVAARRLRAFTLAGTHPALIGDEPMTPAEIVSTLLHGIQVS